MKRFFTRLRDRQHLRKINKEKHELISPTPRYGYTEARVRWLNARLALAVKNNDLEEVERLKPLCVAAREEFQALLAANKLSNDRARAGLLVGVRQ
jgi:hypothetical protein